jgi:ubiquinone/menaquinone biosynthesis C-methylase UbiE
MKIAVEDVRAFWDANPCNSDLSRAKERLQYFQEISDKRYGCREWHVPIVAKFDTFRDNDVLEIGCGIGTDGLEFAKNGARYVGVDLTSHAVELAKERFALFGMSGQFQIANAQELPFANDSFDHVYSFGVIHHSPAPEKIVREIHRVLKKGGSFTVMLYNKSSINYYIEIMFLRRLSRWLLLPSFMPRLIAAATGFDRWKLEGHRKILIERKNMSKQDWISMNTDGPFCPLARVYSRKEAGDLFQEFQNLKQEVWEFNVDHWPFLRRAIPTSLARWIGRHWGWHRIIYGQKS